MSIVLGARHFASPGFKPENRIHVAFAALSDWLSSTSLCADMSQSFQGSIVACLDRRFGLERLFRVGSYEAGTDVLGLTGIDYLAVLDCMRMGDRSTRWLSAVAREVRAVFSSTEEIQLTDFSVKVPFSGSRQRVSIIPAVHQSTGVHGHPIYAIPDGAGRWQLASPGAHRMILEQLDAKRGRKLKSLIRLVKLWRCQHEVEISSYYLEAAAIDYFDRNPMGSEAYSVLALLLYLRECKLAKMPRPGMAGASVALKLSEGARLGACAKVESACEWARQAVFQEQHGNTPAAFAKWRVMFGGLFPAYSFANGGPPAGAPQPSIEVTSGRAGQRPGIGLAVGDSQARNKSLGMPAAWNR